MSIQEIRRRAEELAGRTQTDSIEPHDVGGLIGDLADYVNKVEANGSSLGIRKTYVTISAMEADTNPQDESGNPLKKGMLVSIYNQDDPSSPDNGKVFSWQNPGWQLCYKLDAGYATREELVVLEKRVEALETGYEGGVMICKIVDRGKWSAETAQSNDPYLFKSMRKSTGQLETHDVWLNSCRYRCLKTGTRLRPKWNSPDWVEISGDPKMWMDFEQPNGTEFAHVIDCPIRVHIYKGTEEITDDVLDADIEWTRDTGNPDADIAWTAQHSSFKKYIRITDDDCPPDVWLVKFTCVAFVRDNKGKIEPVENNYLIE